MGVEFHGLEKHSAWKISYGISELEQVSEESKDI